MRIFFCLIFCIGSFSLMAQQPDTDTFFLAKKKGLLGKLGKSISKDDPIVAPVLASNPFQPYAGKRIQSVKVVRLGFNRSFDDTTVIKTNFPIRVANALHKNTREEIIRNNLFFKAGDVLLPFMLSDNERFLRQQDYLQDALIEVKPSENSNRSVDVIVIVRDVFSLGGNLDISSENEGRVELKEENLAGKGNFVSLSTYYDKSRNPQIGLGGEFLRRNIKGSFIDWRLGALNYSSAFNSGRRDEWNVYTILERPMFSRYTRFTGAAEFQINNSYNRYISDSLFNEDFRYRYLQSDFWLGYNIGYKRARLTDHFNRIRHFVSVRTFYNHFFKKPDKFDGVYNYQYADLNGALMSYTLYRQNFYKTGFIYGFGRSEDIPEGLNISATGGWTNKSGKRRGYYGIGAEGSKFFSKGNYYSVILRGGTFRDHGHWVDTDILLDIYHFSALRKMSAKWRHRNFVQVGIAKQINPLLNTPLFLGSDFGLPDFTNSVFGNFRATVKAESVFFNLRKFLGFRFAPFAFTGLTMLTPVDESFSKTNGFTAFGGGIRTRNENLIFGTLELRGAYFPRTPGGMKPWEISFSSNIRFKYNSTFIKKPDFIIAN
ncbi:MAG: hypothetical protein KF829_05395 [Ferruginibacter sp.]|nr:hypothetical protein [Ferruginibacter sp.]